MPRPRLSAQQEALRKASTQALAGPLVLYNCHPGPQDDFRNSQAEEVLYGGAAAGGKSYALRAWAVNYCLTYPGAKIVLFRRTYRELEETHISEIQKEIPLAIATYSSSDHTMIFVHNGSSILFRYCEKEDDVRSYDTAEFDAMLFDEITHFTEFQYTYLLSRCRSTKSWWPGRRIRCAATPLGIGHEWVKRRWVDPTDPSHPNYKGTPVWKAPISEGGMTRQFIQARITDNPTLMKTDPDYINMLRALPREEYLAKAMGDWNVATDQFFTRWRDSIHIIEPFDIPIDWHRFVCHDYGFNAPYCTLWFARPPGSDSVFFYREQYGSGIMLDAQIDLAWQSTKESSEKLRGVVLDPSEFAKVNVKGARLESPADDWRKIFGKVTNIYPGNNERVAGWKLLREMIDWKEGPDGRVIIPPRFFVFKTCTNLARTLPRLRVDKHHVEDVDTDGEDHAADAARYGLRFAFEGAGKGGNRRYYMTPSGLKVQSGA